MAGNFAALSPAMTTLMGSGRSASLSFFLTKDNPSSPGFVPAIHNRRRCTAGLFAGLAAMDGRELRCAQPGHDDGVGKGKERPYRFGTFSALREPIR
jgi:hypothetical protein